MNAVTDQEHSALSAEAAYAEIIQDAYNALGKVTHKALRLPYATYRNAPNGRVEWRSMQEAVEDGIQHDQALALLMDVLSNSPCVLVHKLRDFLRDDYVARNAADIAEVV